MELAYRVTPIDRAYMKESVQLIMGEQLWTNKDFDREGRDDL